VHGEDERQAIRMQEMMQQMQREEHKRQEEMQREQERQQRNTRVVNHEEIQRNAMNNF